MYVSSDNTASNEPLGLLSCLPNRLSLIWSKPVAIGAHHMSMTLVVITREFIEYQLIPSGFCFSNTVSEVLQGKVKEKALASDMDHLK